MVKANNTMFQFYLAMMDFDDLSEFAIALVRKDKTIVI